jgi:3-phenylpropionate/trans-cinnamate dioxygenase ferredoxin subunit
MSFTRACALADVPTDTAISVDLGGKDLVAVVNTAEGVFAVRDRCSHADVPLSEGWVEGCTLECSAHGARFDLRSGVPLDPPAVTHVPTYPVRIEAGDIYIDQDNPIASQEN